jgi:hypothetical protein
MRTMRTPRCSQFNLIVVTLSASACQPANDARVSNDTVANETTRLPSLPVVEAPLDRAAVLQAVAKAASAAALGQDDKIAQRELDGDRFTVRIRFGCPSPEPSVENGPFSVRYDVDGRRLQVRASPDLTEVEPWIAALGGDTIEAVEGFWMRKPWLLAPGCPVAEQAPSSITPKSTDGGSQPVTTAGNEWRVGIAQFFGATETRTTRRDHRAYEATKTLSEGQPPPAQGFDLILSGRLRELANGRVIACHVASHRAPPECVVSVSYDQVRIERADTQETLAEWGS